ncbi:PLP-dependent aminotransferase family protein, partial [Pseudomonas sp. SIMBA_067]
GDTVLCDPLTYPGLLLAAQQLGLRIVAVPGDADGMRPDHLEQACQQSGARLLYLNPTFQNPTAHTMPVARRQAIAEVLLKCG